MDNKQRVVRKTRRERKDSEERRKRRKSKIRKTPKKKSYTKKNIRSPRPRQSIFDVYVPIKYDSSSNYTTASDLSSSNYFTANEFLQKKIIF